MSDCATKLAEAKDAYHERMTGNGTRSIADSDMKQEFFDMKIDNLERYISNLEIECGNGTGRKRGSVRFYG